MASSSSAPPVMVTSPAVGCQLLGLKINLGFETKTFASRVGEPASALSMSVDQDETQSCKLRLQAHQGEDLLLSLNLSDLLEQQGAIDRAISRNRDTRQIRILVEHQDSTITAYYAEERTFNITVCLLAQFGFLVGTHETTAARPPNHEESPDHGFGPRLSSITPITAPPGFEVQNSGSLSTSQHDPHLQDPFTDNAYPPHAAISKQIWPLTEQTASLTFADLMPTISQFNPYEVFAGQMYEQYRPKTSSPLRNAWRPGTLSRSNSNSARPRWPFARQEVDLIETSIPPNSPGSMHSSPIPNPSNTPWPKMQVLKDLAQTALSIRGSSRSHGHHQVSSNDKDYQKQMPPARNLPFNSGAKKRPRENSFFVPEPEIGDLTESIETSSPTVKKTTSRDKAPIRKRAKKTPQMQHLTQQRQSNYMSSIDTDDESLTPGTRHDPYSGNSLPARTSTLTKTQQLMSKETHNHTHTTVFTPAVNADRQTEAPQVLQSPDTRESTPLPSTIPDSRQTTDFSAPRTPSPSSPTVQNPVPSIETRLMLLVADDSVLNQINQFTDKILDQYEADVRRGCDELNRAQFYMERIFTARKDFWYSTLQDSERSMRVTTAR